MTNAFALPKKLLVLGIVLPLAVFLGYLMANPDSASYAFVGLVAMVLSLPIFLRWHHPLVVLGWNMPVILFFLPGSPPFWMVASLGSLGLTLLGSILDKEKKMIHVPSVFWWLVALVVVVLITMKANGGIGLRSFGASTYGGKKYFFLIFSLIAFVAISAQRIPLEKAQYYTGMFTLPAAATFLSNLVYMAGPGLWFLFYLIPVDWALGQAHEDFSGNIGSANSGRIGGLGVAGSVVVSFLVARYGLRGILDFGKPWRFALFVALVLVTLMGGFRSAVVTFGLMMTLQFFLEGLHRTRLCLVLVLTAVVGFVLLIPLARKLPMPIQRSLSILPLDIHPAARADAKGSSEWRLRMWRVLVPEIPKYLLIGKGFTASATDYYFAMESQRRGMGEDFDVSLIAGDYHNGPLSILIPFGLPGMITFLGFVVASIQVLRRNYLYGDARLKTLNTYLLASFLTKVIFFFVVFGAIATDLTALAGFVGLSISLNGGVRRETDLVEAKPATEPLKPELPQPRPGPFSRNYGGMSRR